MVTKYDVFAKIIEHSPCSVKDLGFSSPVYSHVNDLKKDKLIEKKDNLLIPVKNNRSRKIFEVIKYCLKNSLNYNVMFRSNFSVVVKEVIKNVPNIISDKLNGNRSNIDIIKFLVNNQFILLHKKRPMKGVLLSNKTIENNIVDYKQSEILVNNKQVLKVNRFYFNPFENKVFEFLSGSAQLEGSTVSIGETIDILTKDIYPDKPQKDIQMVKNLNEAMLYVADNIESNLDLEKIKKLNELCLFSLHRGAGKFKISENKIYGNPEFKTVSSDLVEFELMKFCEVFNSIKTRDDCLNKIGYIHNQFQRIHPFSDGNSRVTRLIVNWLLLKFNFQLFVLKVGAFDAYMNLTKLSSIREDERVRKFILALLLHESFIKND